MTFLSTKIELIDKDFAIVYEFRGGSGGECVKLGLTSVFNV